MESAVDSHEHKVQDLKRFQIKLGDLGNVFIVTIKYE